MMTFALTMCIFLFLESVANAICLALNRFPERSPVGMLANAIVNGGLALWGAFVIGGAA